MIDTNNTCCGLYRLGFFVSFLEIDINGLQKCGRLSSLIMAATLSNRYYGGFSVMISLGWYSSYSNVDVI